MTLRDWLEDIEDNQWHAARSIPSKVGRALIGVPGYIGIRLVLSPIFAALYVWDSIYGAVILYRGRGEE